MYLVLLNERFETNADVIFKGARGVWHPVANGRRACMLRVLQEMILLISSESSRDIDWEFAVSRVDDGVRIYLKRALHGMGFLAQLTRWSGGHGASSIANTKLQL